MSVTGYTKAKTDELFDVYGTVIPVTAYGAVGDGTTDDTTAVQAALTASTSSTTIVLPAGKTFLVGPITIASGRLLSDGGVLKLKASTESNANLLTVTGNNVTLDGLVIDGNSAGQTNAIIGIRAVSVSGLTIKNCRITDMTKDAIRISGACDDLTIRDNHVSGLAMTAAGISVLASGSRMSVSRNRVSVTTGQAVLIHSETAPLIYGLDVIGNIIDSAGQIPLEVFDAETVVISGNAIIAGNRGISLARVDNVSITGNTVKNQTTYAVELSSACDGVTISGNTVLNCARFIEASSVTALSVTGNVAIGTGLSGTVASSAYLRINTGSNIVIANNVIADWAYLTNGIRIGVGSAPVGVSIVNNRFLVNNANTSLTALNVAQATNVTVQGNQAYLTRAFVAGDANARIMSVTQGSCTGVQFRNNVIEVTGDTSAATSVVGIGTGFAAASTLAKSCIVGNQVVGAPNAFRADVTSADFVISGNDGSGSTTEWANINAAVIIRSTARVTEGTTAPASGTWRRGDICWNTTPSAAGVPGWMCTSAGTPGTWKAMANLAS